MVFSLENDFLKISIDSMGAELVSVISKKYQKETLWQADPDIWPRHAPNLFPIVGKLNQSSFLHEGTMYTMPPHGFARDTEFRIIQEGQTYLKATLTASEQTKSCYPWDFQFEIEYTLEGDRLNVVYHVKNTDHNVMYYSIGTHPGFNIYKALENTTLIFDKDDDLVSIVKFEADGLVPARTPISQKSFALSDTIFDGDAFVFADLESRSLTIDTGAYIVETGWGDEFPLLALWSKPKAPYVCVEAWAGLADYKGKAKEIKDKHYIEHLSPNEYKQYPWFIRIK